MASTGAGPPEPEQPAPESSNDRTSPSNRPTKLCATCDKPTELGCSKCGNISYCSEPCQTADWPIHKLVCWQFHLFQESDRPTPWHIRAVIFPVYIPRPRFIWLRMINQYHRDTRQYLGDENYVEKQGWHNYACRTRPVNSQPLYFYSISPSCDSYNQRLPNAAIPALSSVPGLSFLWRGTVIATGEYGDLNMRDFRAAVDFLQAFPKNLALMDPARYQGPCVDGVKLNCDDAVAEHGVRHLQPVKMTEHMLAHHGPSRLLVFPTLQLVVRFAPPIGARARRGRNPHCVLALVQEKVFSRMSAKVMRLDDLKTLMQGTYGLGTMIMHRADRRPLLPVHVLALEEFVREKAELVADGQGKVWRDSIALHLRPENFAAFWPGFLDRHDMSTVGGLAPPSPFEM